jgi:hypothetical protein
MADWNNQRPASVPAFIFLGDVNVGSGTAPIARSAQFLFL